MLRTPDAIHLATALLLREDVEVLISYDDRLTAAAAAHGLATATPGGPAQTPGGPTQTSG